MYKDCWINNGLIDGETYVVRNANWFLLYYPPAVISTSLLKDMVPKLIRFHHRIITLITVEQNQRFGDLILNYTKTYQMWYHLFLSILETNLQLSSRLCKILPKKNCVLNQINIHLHIELIRIDLRTTLLVCFHSYLSFMRFTKQNKT